MFSVTFLGTPMVDTDLSTVERINTETEKNNLSHLCLRYEAKSMPEAIRSHLPKSPIVKRVDDRVLVGRSKNADVFLNDKCMSRNYIEIWGSNCDLDTFFIKNISQSKSVKIDGHSLRNGELGTLKDKSELVLDYITFAVYIKPGDEESSTYVLSTECCDDLENAQDIYIIRGDILQNQELFSGFTLIPGYPGSAQNGSPFHPTDRNGIATDYQNGQILGRFSIPTVSKAIGIPSSNFSAGNMTPPTGMSPVESAPIYMYNDQINNFTMDSPCRFRQPQEHSMNDKMKRLPCEGVDDSVENNKEKEFCEQSEKPEQY